MMEFEDAAITIKKIEIKKANDTDIKVVCQVERTLNEEDLKMLRFTKSAQS